MTLCDDNVLRPIHHMHQCTVICWCRTPDLHGFEYKQLHIINKVSLYNLFLHSSLSLLAEPGLFALGVSILAANELGAS